MLPSGDCQRDHGCGQCADDCAEHGVHLPPAHPPARRLAHHRDHVRDRGCEDVPVLFVQQVSIQQITKILELLSQA